MFCVLFFALFRRRPVPEADVGMAWCQVCCCAGGICVFGFCLLPRGGVLAFAGSAWRDRRQTSGRAGVSAVAFRPFVSVFAHAVVGRRVSVCVLVFFFFTSGLAHRVSSSGQVATKHVRYIVLILFVRFFFLRLLSCACGVSNRGYSFINCTTKSFCS